MKKILLIIVFCVFLEGCGNKGISQEEYDEIVAERNEYKKELDLLSNSNEEEQDSGTENNETEDNETEDNETEDNETEDNETETNGDFELNIEEADNQVEVVEEYYYFRWEDKARYFIVVQNNTNDTVSIDASVIAKDKEGNLLGAKNESLKAVSPGQQMVMGFYFDDAEDAAIFDYDLEYEKSEKFKSYYDDLEWEVSVNKDKLIILITNNGEEKVEHVMPYALFFKDGNIFGHEFSGYIDIEAEETVPIELECSTGEFEDYELYIYAW